MTRKLHFLMVLVFLLLIPGTQLTAQDMLIKRMQQYERNILRSYLEYQKLYYEDKSRTHELRAFEDLLTVYINQVMEIYDTLNLSKKKSSTPRDIVSRALIIKSLMFLEKAPLNPEYYERACYEYYEAFNLYDGTDEPPVIYKNLPQTIQAGDKTYYRLKELIDDKGAGLKKFGKVKIRFRNFMVTANFDPDLIELSKLGDDAGVEYDISYHLAEERLKKAFTEIFLRNNKEVETYIALPQGTYLLKLLGREKSDFTPLTRFYVQANQEHFYFMEPLADWVILYENPTSKKPDYYKFSRNHQPGGATNGNGVSSSKHSKAQTSARSQIIKHEGLVAEMVAAHLPNFKVTLMFDLNDPEIKENAIEIIARSVVKYVDSGAFYNKWNQWAASWEISKDVREIISPGSLIPIQLIELVHTILSEL